ncbi:MAG TPA: hypothetical protein VF797_22985 [Noviherbaspirillum sp.]
MKMQEVTRSVGGTSRGPGAISPTAPERGACKRHAIALGLGLPEAGASQAMPSETSRTTRARVSTEAASYRALSITV